jgi:hypothetical protein
MEDQWQATWIVVTDYLTPQTVPPVVYPDTAESILCRNKYSVQPQHSSHYSLMMHLETVSETMNSKSIFQEDFIVWSKYMYLVWL